MTKLNYHKDKNFFMDWLMMNEMATGEIVLWHTLMNIGNRLGQKNIFNAPTSTVMKLTGLSKQGLMNARRKLMNRGFITYQKGQQNKAPVYKLLPIHQTLDKYLSFVQTQTLTQDLTPQLTRDLTPELTIHKVQNTKEKSSGRGNTHEENIILKIYEENLNQLTPMLKEELRNWQEIFNDKIILQGIRETVKRGGKSFRYLEQILKNWKYAGLSTLEEVVTYELEKEIAKNKKIIPFQKQAQVKQSNDDLYTELLKEDF